MVPRINPDCFYTINSKAQVSFNLNILIQGFGCTAGNTTSGVQVKADSGDFSFTRLDITIVLRPPGASIIDFSAHFNKAVLLSARACSGQTLGFVSVRVRVCVCVDVCLVQSRTLVLLDRF